MVSQRGWHAQERERLDARLDGVAYLAHAAGDGVERDALLRHAPVRLGHQLDQRVQRDLEPRDVLRRAGAGASAQPPASPAERASVLQGWFPTHHSLVP